MGWSFCDNWNTKAQARAGILDEISGNESGKVIAHRTVGNHLWLAYESLPAERLIVLCLMERARGCWGYKVMDEAMGPYYYDCPLALLEMCPIPPANAPIALVWREKVYAYHAKRKERARALRHLAVGATVTTRPGWTPNVFRLTSVKPLRGIDPATGRAYRLVKSRITECSPAPTSTASESPNA